MDKPRKPAIRHSLLWKLFGSVLLCLFVLLLFNWLLNNFALVSYYQRAKESMLAGTFHTIDAASADRDTMTETLYALRNDKNITSLIWNRRGVVYNYRSGAEGDRIGGFMLIPPPLDAEPGSYTIRLSTDDRTKSEFISLDGVLSNGDSIMLRTPVAAIEESVDITNQFLLISGAVTLLISLLLILLVARSFTRPIRELSRVAESVARLDFSDRYTHTGSDELSALGNNINAMSAALEHTISDLKTANMKLAGDVERTTRQNEARKAFIANVSHELKTPISLIQTYAEGLREDIAEGADNRDYYCEVIEDESQKMSDMLRKMTMLMQLEAGGDQLDIERFDVAELMRNLMLKNNFRFAQHDVVPVPPPETPVFVWADAFLIENVLTNYLSNALNHVNDGGRVTCTVTPQPNGRARIAVYNTGSHIPQEELPRVWESFYKVDKARTRAYGGTGIGLSVVAAIMNAHHMPYGVVNRLEDGIAGVEFFIELSQQ